MEKFKFIKRSATTPTIKSDDLKVRGGDWSRQFGKVHFIGELINTSTNSPSNILKLQKLQKCKKYCLQTFSKYWCVIIHFTPIEGFIKENVPSTKQISLNIWAMSTILQFWLSLISNLFPSIGTNAPVQISIVHLRTKHNAAYLD